MSGRNCIVSRSVSVAGTGTSCVEVLLLDRAEERRAGSAASRSRRSSGRTASAPRSARSGRSPRRSLRSPRRRCPSPAAATLAIPSSPSRRNSSVSTRRSCAPFSSSGTSRLFARSTSCSAWTFDAVDVAREVDLAVARVLEQVEERRALLVRLGHELLRVAHVVLEPLLLLGRLAAADPEEEQQQDEQPPADRDRPPDEQCLGVGRRPSGRRAARRPGRARLVVAFVEEGQTAESMPLFGGLPGILRGQGGARQGTNLRTCNGTTCDDPGAARHRAHATGCAPDRRRDAPDAGPGPRPLPARADARRRRLRRRLAGARRAAPARRRRQGDPARARRTGERASGITRPSARRRPRRGSTTRAWSPSTSSTTTSTRPTWCRSWFGAEPSPSWPTRARCPTATSPASALALCDALDHAHERGVIHRDVKPQNVMVLAEPDAGAGLRQARRLRRRAPRRRATSLTRTGDVVGTLAYMAPEQAEGLRVTPAADVYSLALMLYEGWTGVNPVRGHGPAGTARRLGRRLPRLADRRRDLPYELCDAIDACLDPNPARRPAHRRAAPRRWRTPSRTCPTRAAWSSRRRSSASGSRARATGPSSSGWRAPRSTVPGPARRPGPPPAR